MTQVILFDSGTFFVIPECLSRGSRFFQVDEKAQDSGLDHAGMTGIEGMGMLISCDIKQEGKRGVWAPAPPGPIPGT